MKAPDTATIRAAGRHAEHTARQTVQHPAITHIARCGFAARGVLYLIIGGLAVANAMLAALQLDNRVQLALLVQDARLG